MIATTGLVWEQKGQSHSTLNTHMENIDILINEEAQQDMDLKSAFAPAVPRQPFFRAILGDPKQSPGGVADDQKTHRTLLLKAPIGLRADHRWYMPHEVPAVFSKLLHRCQGVRQEDMEQATDAVSKTPLGRTWFRPDTVAATTPFRIALQKTYSNFARVDLSLSEGLLIGLGYAATSPDSPIGFHQAQSAAERSGVAGLHQWSIMLPTSAQVSQEVYEPLIGTQYPMLRSRKHATWQIGTASIRADHRVATGLRFVDWCHSSQNEDAVNNPPANQTILAYNHLEDQLSRASAGSDAVLVLTTTRISGTTLQGYFHDEGKQANAETAVKVGGATARRCIVMHGRTAFLSGNGRNVDFDAECYTRANVAYSRATDLTILACPANMYDVPGALQVIATLLHGVHTIHANDSLELAAIGTLRLDARQVSDATAAFQAALMPHELWTGPLPVCLAEHHEGRVRRLRLVLAPRSLLHLHTGWAPFSWE